MTAQEFEHIARTLRPRLKAVGRQFWNDEDRAEDTAQETLIRLWMVSSRLGKGDNVEALAVRMAKNWCVSQWRKEQHDRTDSLGQQHVGRLAQPADTGVQAEDTLRELQAAIGQLTKAEQRLFRMRHEQEMDIPQIAAATGIHPRSISAMLSTARRKLQAILKERGTI